MKAIILESTGFGPQRLAQQFYGHQVQAYRIDTYAPNVQSWRAYYATKPRAEWFHVVAAQFASRPYLELVPTAAEIAAKAVERERRRRAGLEIHTWGIWPERLEFLMKGNDRALCAGVGRIKAALTRHDQATSSPDEAGVLVWALETWVIPLGTAAQRLQCLNRLRHHMRQSYAA